MKKKYAITFGFKDGVKENTNIEQEFIEAIKECGFTEHIGDKLYAINENEDGIKILIDLQTKLLSKFGNDLSWLKKVMVFLIEEYGDVTKLLTGSN